MLPLFHISYGHFQLCLLISNSRLFFELCRKFNIQYSIAITQEKAFIDEVTEFMYKRKKAEEDEKASTQSRKYQ